MTYMTIDMCSGLVIEVIPWLGLATDNLDVNGGWAGNVATNGCCVVKLRLNAKLEMCSCWASLVPIGSSSRLFRLHSLASLETMLLMTWRWRWRG